MMYDVLAFSMGLDIHAYNFLKYCSRYQVLGKTLTIGRQSVYLDKFTSPHHIGLPFPHHTGEPFCEALLKREFNATEVESLDGSSYEDATYVHDLCCPLSVPLQGLTYDSVIELGTLEHVFNVQQSFKNIASLCRVGGQIIHATPGNDHLGHGLYQFSPEFYFSLYNVENGFSEPEVFLFDVYKPNTWIKAYRPSNGRRIELSRRSLPTCGILVRTTKLRTDTAQDVIQSDYVHIWNSGNTNKRSKSGLRSNLENLINNKLSFNTRGKLKKIFFLSDPFKHPLLLKVKVGSLLSNSTKLPISIAPHD